MGNGTPKLMVLKVGLPKAIEAARERVTTRAAAKQMVVVEDNMMRRVVS